MELKRRFDCAIEQLIDDFLGESGKSEAFNMNRRMATIRIRREHSSVTQDMHARFVGAWKTGKYQGEHFDFESPAALSRVLSPKRWELLKKLQVEGPIGVRALARAVERDVRRVHDDAQALIEVGLVEKDNKGKLFVPFEGNQAAQSVV